MITYHIPDTILNMFRVNILSMFQSCDSQCECIFYLFIAFSTQNLPFIPCFEKYRAEPFKYFSFAKWHKIKHYMELGALREEMMFLFLHLACPPSHAPAVSTLPASGSCHVQQLTGPVARIFPQDSRDSSSQPSTMVEASP